MTYNSLQSFLSELRATLPAMTDTRDLYHLEICQPVTLFAGMHLSAYVITMVLLSALLHDDEDADMGVSGIADVSASEMEDAYEERIIAAKSMSTLVKLIRRDGLAPIYADISGMVCCSHQLYLIGKCLILGFQSASYAGCKVLIREIKRNSPPASDSDAARIASAIDALMPLLEYDADLSNVYPSWRGWFSDLTLSGKFAAYLFLSR